jgi:predicted transcriptional regulator
MSEKLRSALYFLVEEEKRRLDGELAAYADALVRSIDPNGLALTIVVEGVNESDPVHRILDELCKVGLVTIDTHYTHRNVQLTAHATPLGVQIGQQLKEEKGVTVD